MQSLPEKTWDSGASTSESSSNQCQQQSQTRFSGPGMPRQMYGCSRGVFMKIRYLYVYNKSIYAFVVDIYQFKYYMLSRQTLACDFIMKIKINGVGEI